MQKALRSLETGCDGFDEQLSLPLTEAASDRLAYELRWPGPNRILYVADAFRAGWTRAQVFEATHIDPWFLAQIEDLVREEALLRGQGFDEPGPRAPACAQAQGVLRRAHRGLGGARRGRDAQPPAQARAASGVQARRHLRRGVRDADRLPVLHLRGGVRGESEQPQEDHDPGRRPEPDRPGHRVRLLLRARRAWRCARTASRPSWSTAIPETVSTDYDTSDRLYFEPLTFEDVMEIIDKEKPEGVIVQFGGQTPLKLSPRARPRPACPSSAPRPDSIDIAEDRERFQKLVTA